MTKYATVEQIATDAFSGKFSTEQALDAAIDSGLGHTLKYAMPDWGTPLPVCDKFYELQGALKKREARPSTTRQFNDAPRCRQCGQTGQFTTLPDSGVCDDCHA